MSPKTIYFEKNTASYSEFHNFSQHDVMYNGKRYPTGEHLYQAFKVMDAHPDIAERIRNCGNSALDAFNAGHGQYQRWVRSDWAQVEVQKMELVQRLKFTQHANLKALLLSTGDAELVLDSPRDFWGIGANRTGRNELGKILMRLRGEFSQQAPNKFCANGCLLCGKPSSKGPFCSKTCSSKVETNAPKLVEVPTAHDIFKSVSDQFRISWRQSTASPTVRRVYKIVEQPSCIAQYEAYRASVEAQGKFVAAGRSPGNENRRWHGTRRDCLLGDNGNTTFCSSSTCALCNIIRTSFKVSLAGRGRFGKGIYTSSTSSKSNGYSSNAKTSNQKAMLLNKVVVGRGYKLTQDDSTLNAPPPGYHSVLAEVSPGGSVSQDELICYTDSAVRPSYLLIYDA